MEGLGGGGGPGVRPGRLCDRRIQTHLRTSGAIAVIYDVPSGALWRTVLGRLRTWTLALCSLLVSDGCVAACEVPASPMSSRRNLNLERKSCQTTYQPAGRQKQLIISFLCSLVYRRRKTGNQGDLKHLNTEPREDFQPQHFIYFFIFRSRLKTTATYETSTVNLCVNNGFTLVSTVFSFWD